MENFNSGATQFPKMLAALLIFLAILFFIPDVLMYKIIKIGPIEESAAILFFPLIYSIADSITEVYGRNRTFFILMNCYVTSLIFSVLVRYVVVLPSPTEWLYQPAFNIVFSKGPRIIIAGFLGVTISMYVNVKIMSGLKKKLRGRHFLIRSIISSSIGELIVTGISYPIIFPANKHDLAFLMLNAYFFKVLYSMVAAFPAKMLVFLLREIDGIKYTEFSEEVRNFQETAN